ncbi:MAG TPA: elongation factor P [Patescibacteria group bacterium]|nr:elongation factor P [Patescibacteria group bacterium]
MAAIPVNSLRSGVVFEMDGQPWLVQKYYHTKVGRGNATITVRVRNLKTGAVLEKKFNSGARVEETFVERMGVQFLYTDNEGLHFMNNTSYEQYTLDVKAAGEASDYLKEGMDVSLLFYHGEPLTVDIPNTVEFIVSEAGPAEKGNSVANVFKEVVLENGFRVKVPMFIKEGDKIRVDTRTGSYIERVTS